MTIFTLSTLFRTRSCSVCHWANFVKQISTYCFRHFDVSPTASTLASTEPVGKVLRSHLDMVAVPARSRTVTDVVGLHVSASPPLRFRASC